MFRHISTILAFIFILTYSNTSLARYVESDPIGLDGGNNVYIYAEDNPIKLIDPLGLKTYKCTKPLHALGGTGRRSGPDIPGNPLYHEYLCVYNSSSAACGGQDRTGGPWSPGTPSLDVFNTARCDQVEPDNKCIEDCLLGAFAGPRPYYGLCGPGTNCQEWADSTLKSCRKKCSGCGK